jgi:serine/threonine protein kinase
MHTARLSSAHTLAPFRSPSGAQSIDDGNGHRPDQQLVKSEVGQRLGPYNICFELACGGMATVYLAKKAAPDGDQRYVALKIIHRHLASDQNFIQMFLDEATIASQIRHPNVCHVFEFDEVDGHYYLAMEYLMGEPLSLFFRRTLRAPPTQTALLADRFACLVADVCNGLHAAHELCDTAGNPLGIVHRDISPENIFVSYDGVVKLVDFGLAISAHQTHTTRAGIVRGKFAYIAPEVVYGMRPDRRADVFSLGIVLWELLTGRRLFKRETDAETLRAITDAPILPPSQLRAGLPHELDEVVMGALERNPDQRYATARQFGSALLRHLSRRRAKVGPSDIAAWMAESFVEERRRKQQLLDAFELVGRKSEPMRPLAQVTAEQVASSGIKSRALSRLALSPARRRHSLFAGAAVLGISALAAGGAWKSGAFESIPAGTLPVLLPKETATLASTSSDQAGLIFVHEGTDGSGKTDGARRIELEPGKSYVLEIQPAARSQFLVRIRSGSESREAFVVEAGEEPSK